MKAAAPLARRPAAEMGEGRRRIGRVLIPLLVLAAYLLWPYLTLWRLDRALVSDDHAVLAGLMDLSAVRAEILSKLNKEAQSSIGPMSDAFIDWLEQSIRRNGAAALERQVTPEWVRAVMLRHSPPGAGLAPALTRAFFDDPLHFSLRLGPPDDTPVFVRLSFRGIGWRITALYY